MASQQALATALALSSSKTNWDAVVPARAPPPPPPTEEDDSDDEEDEQVCPLCSVGNCECDCSKCGVTGCFECVTGGHGLNEELNLCPECAAPPPPPPTEEDEEKLLEEFWNGGMVEMWGSALREGHPLWEPYKLYKAMKKEQDE
jgi:hypothetical protein